MYDSFAEAEKRSAAYILEHPNDVVRYSITELAENCEVSEATVVRMCQKLGLEGFQDLKVTLAQSYIHPLWAINESISEDDSYEEIIHKVFNTVIETIQYTKSVLDFDALKRAANLIYKAEKVIVVGQGSSASMVADLSHKLARLGLNVMHSSDPHMQVILASGVKKGSVMVTISHSGSSKDVVEAAKLWRKGGGKVVAITKIGSSPLTKVADIVLATASPDTTYKFTALTARAGQIGIIDAIYTLLSFEYQNELVKRFVQIDKQLLTKKY